jgi:hypothetical protein
MSNLFREIMIAPDIKTVLASLVTKIIVLADFNLMIV